MADLIPHHIGATADDIKGNNGLGRYIILTGSSQRAYDIEQLLINTHSIPHARQHNLHIGKLPSEQGEIDVGVISTGMGGPSADIIINELIMLGARRFLRVGTAGSLQPTTIPVGDIVVATAAVRDDKASWDYIYREYPAFASLEYIIAAKRASLNFIKKFNIHFGVVHSKSSLFAREHGLSLLPENSQYMGVMREAGVLASEMECAQLFTLCTLLTAKLKREAVKFADILCGCILAIVGDQTAFSDDQNKVQKVINNSIQLSLTIIKEMNAIDKQQKSLF